MEPGLDSIGNEFNRLALRYFLDNQLPQSGLVLDRQRNFGPFRAGGLISTVYHNNFDPNNICTNYLGDSGSLLIGLLIGVVGVQGSLKEGATISILFPILAMGLPITDTAMAIFRRWVRNLPLSSADRRHVHHLLIGRLCGRRSATPGGRGRTRPAEVRGCGAVDARESTRHQAAQ